MEHERSVLSDPHRWLDTSVFPSSAIEQAHRSVAISLIGTVFSTYRVGLVMVPEVPLCSEALLGVTSEIGYHRSNATVNRDDVE